MSCTKSKTISRRFLTGGATLDNATHSEPLIKQLDPNTGICMWPGKTLRIPGLELFGHCQFTKAGPPLDPHDHGTCIEIIFVVAGRDSYSVGGQTYELSGNSVFVAMPGEEHQSHEDYQGLSEHVWVQLDLAVSRDFLGLSEANAAEMKRRLRALDKHQYSTSPGFIKLVKDCYRALDTRGTGLYFNALLVDVLSRFLYVESAPPAADRDVERILQYMQENFRDNTLTLGLVAERCNMSESGLKHKFRQVTGDTAGHYLTRLRIDHAKRLLSEGASVTGAAMDAGFGSSDYFAVVFKKYTRQTPSAYARAAREKDGKK